MREYKKDTAWGILLTVLAAVPLILGVIPGITQVESFDNAGVVYPSNLLRLEEWNNGGITGALIMVVHVYSIIMCAFYIRNQSTGLAKGIFLGSAVAVVVGVAAILTETQLRPAPFFVIPVIDGISAVLGFFRIRYEEDRYGIYD